jgi:hypothetical protein
MLILMGAPVLFSTATANRIPACNHSGSLGAMLLPVRGSG